MPEQTFAGDVSLAPDNRRCRAGAAPHNARPLIRRIQSTKPHRSAPLVVARQRQGAGVVTRHTQSVPKLDAWWKPTLRKRLAFAASLRHLGLSPPLQPCSPASPLLARWRALGAGPAILNPGPEPERAGVTTGTGWLPSACWRASELCHRYQGARTHALRDSVAKWCQGRATGDERQRCWSCLRFLGCCRRWRSRRR